MRSERHFADLREESGWPRVLHLKREGAMVTETKFVVVKVHIEGRQASLVRTALVRHVLEHTRARERRSANSLLIDAWSLLTASPHRPVRDCSSSTRCSLWFRTARMLLLMTSSSASICSQVALAACSTLLSTSSKIFARMRRKSNEFSEAAARRCDSAQEESLLTLEQRRRCHHI